MLAVTPDASRSLGLISVVLQSVDGTSSTPVSESLKAHVLGVLRSATEIVADPRAIAPGTSPEAIELAFRLQGNSLLRQRIAEIGAFDAIRPDMAKDILDSLQPVAA